MCRAICLATGLKYRTVENLLSITAKAFDSEKLWIGCYHKLLEDVFEFPVIYCQNGETVSEIAEKMQDVTLIVRIEGHLTCVVRGVCHDIWDCTKEKADCFWIAKTV